MNIPGTSNPRVVIVGGGFGGLQLAKNLRKKNFQVVLLDKQNYHAFQPLLYQVATAGLEPGSIAYPFRKIIHHFENYFFRMCEVHEVVSAQNKVITDIGELTYDYLVLATGATSNFFGMNEVEQHAMPMKSVSEALDIRSLMLQNFEKALLISDLHNRESMMSIIIVGGGPTGVELAGAIAELRKDILPNDYPDLDIRAMDIHLVEAGDRLLKEMSPESGQKAYDALKKMDVDIWLDTRLANYDGSVMTTSDGKKMEASMLIWAAGVKAVIPSGIGPDAIGSGRILVDQFNRVKGLSNVFAIGDVAKMVTDKYPMGYPMVAQPAMQQGKLLAKNIQLLRRKKEMTPFEYKDLGSMATIGRAKAVVELKHLKLSGWFAWVTWLFVHVYQLIGFRNKIVVILSWSQNYFRHARDLRLIIRPFRKTR